MHIQPPSARELILTLIDSAASKTLSARYFVAAGELFEVDPRSIRVALGRLVKDGSLAQVERGIYSLGSRGGTLHRLVRNWSRVETSLKPWRGGWLTVLTGHLARSDRTKKRSRERALRLFGFAESRTGLWVRPDNLVTDMQSLHASLLELGLDDDALAAVVSELLPREAIDAASLWDRAALEARYTDHLQALSASMAKLASLPAEHAATETLLLGRAVTRDILLDPLLPDELVNTTLRRNMVEAMRQYDRQGRSFWRAFYKAHN